MVRDISGIISAFRESRGQVSSPPPAEENVYRKRATNSYYEQFLKKCENLDKHIDKFSLYELVLYFREIATQNGYKYHINRGKDIGMMKHLKEDYSNREICGMIEFLYTSDQDYLEKDSLHIGLLCSGWVNTIYADMNKWVNDEYVPNKSKKALKTHEWDRNIAGTKDDTKIGVKL